MRFAFEGVGGGGVVKTGVALDLSHPICGVKACGKVLCLD